MEKRKSKLTPPDHNAVVTITARYFWSLVHVIIYYQNGFVAQIKHRACIILKTHYGFLVNRKN